MLLKEFISKTVSNYLNEHGNSSQNNLYNAIYKLRQNLALAAQKVYDEWTQDEDGIDDIYGSGGICDDISEAMCDVINDETEYNCFYLYNEYDCHTSIYVYERGTGYNWKKINDISFNVNHITIHEVDWDDYLDEEGNIKNEWY